MSSTPLPTKDQMFSDLRHVLWVFANVLDRIYAPGCAGAVLEPERKMLDSDKQFVSQLDPAQIDISRFAVTPVMDALFEYAINGRWDERNYWIDLVTDTQAFLTGLSRFDLMGEGFGYGDWVPALEQCIKVLNIAEARQLLDDVEETSDGGVRDRLLTFGQVALLANMDEKSVRNAANPKSKDPLKTFIDGSRTYVQASDARDWLSRRRGFKPTESFDSKADDRDLAKVGFSSAADFSDFIRLHCARLNQSHATLVAAMGNPLFSTTQLEQLEQGQFCFDLTVFAQLASALELNVETFLRASHKLYLKLENSRFEDELQQLAR